MLKEKNGLLRLIKAGIIPAALASAGHAQTTADASDAEDWAIHGQFTGTEQGHPSYHSSYEGSNSLDHKVQRNETTDATLFVGVSPWAGAQFWAEPEIDQGFGLSNTLGVAGFTSGEAYKVGKHRPYFRLPRAYLQQTFNLGDEMEDVKSDLNQLAGQRAKDRVVLTVGKFAVTDIFDNNSYAHDPKNDFLNWSIIEQGAFDYAADAWGFTYGAAAEWYQGRWTLRAGLFDLSHIPNSTALETTPLRQYQTVVEIEERHQIKDRDGKIKVLWFDSEGYMGGYDQAVAYGIANPDAGVSTANVRALHSKQGVGLNSEQQITDDLGAFFRASVAQGKYEAFEFTDINRSISGGFSLAGARWDRPDDAIGAAYVVNGISRAGIRYLAAGGLGVLVGDGQLDHPGSERIGEVYYKATLTSYAALTLDYQYVENPAYNRDRGPVSVLAARLHAQF